MSYRSRERFTLLLDTSTRLDYYDKLLIKKDYYDKLYDTFCDSMLTNRPKVLA